MSGFRSFSTAYAISTTAKLLTPILAPASVSAFKCSTARSDSLTGAVTYQMRIYVSARTLSGSASANEIVADACAHLPAELTEVVITERSPRRRCGNPHHAARSNRRACGDDHPVARVCADLVQLVRRDDQTILGRHRFECGIGCDVPILPQVVCQSDASGRVAGPGGAVPALATHLTTRRVREDTRETTHQPARPVLIPTDRLFGEVTPGPHQNATPAGRGFGHSLPRSSRGRSNVSPHLIGRVL